MPRPSTTKKPRQRQTNTPSTADTGNDSDTSKPEWDSTPSRLPAFCESLQEWLPDQDPRFEPLVTRGWGLDRKQICCVNDNHIKALQDEAFSDDYSFFNPIQNGMEWELIVNGNPIETVVDGVDVFTRGRHCEQPEVIAGAQRSLLTTILSTITDRCTRDDLKKRAAGVLRADAESAKPAEPLLPPEKPASASRCCLS